MEEKSKRVAMDTNMLTAIGQLKVDVFDEIIGLIGRTNFFVPAQVKQELENLAAKKATKAPVFIARQLMKDYNVREIDTVAKSADDALASLAKIGFYVATNDSSLRKRIGSNVIFIRQRKFIELQ